MKVAGLGPRDDRTRYSYMRIDAVARFWANVDRKGPDDCWEWKKYRRAKGHGRVMWGGRFISAHAVALSLTDGVWDSPLQTLHKCDNPPCCNPKHLWRGTNLENNQDMMRKARNSLPPLNFNRVSYDGRGEANGRAKLTAEQVLSIRAQSGRSSTDLGAEFGVSHTVIRHIRQRKLWRHI